MVPTAMNEKKQVLELGALTISVPRLKRGCLRCGGFLVVDHSLDILDASGRLGFEAMRCVQCGDVVDPVILRHRRVRHGAQVVGGGHEAAAPLVASEVRIGVQHGAGAEAQVR